MEDEIGGGKMKQKKKKNVVTREVVLSHSFFLSLSHFLFLREKGGCGWKKMLLMEAIFSGGERWLLGGGEEFGVNGLQY